MSIMFYQYYCLISCQAKTDNHNKHANLNWDGKPRKQTNSEKQTQTKRRHEFDREQVGAYGRKSGRKKYFM